MFSKDSLLPYKNNIINLAVLIIFVFISINVYKGGMRRIALISGKKEIEVKKNAALEEIGNSEKRIGLLKAAANKKDIALVTNIFSGAARESGVEITAINPDQEQDLPLFIKYPFNLIVSAKSYHAAAKFIGKIEGLPDLYTIESAFIEPQINDKESRLETVRLRLRISTFLFKGK